MTGSVTGDVRGPAKRRGYVLAAGMLLVMMLGGTLPVPLYVLYEKQMGFGPLGITVVFAAYVVGTLFALVALGDLSDHFGRRTVLAIAVACAAVSTVLFLAASTVEVLVAARVVSGMAAGLTTGTATAALAELQPRGDHRAAAVTASGSNMTGLGLGPLMAGLFAEYVAMPTRSVFWAYLGLCGLALAVLSAVPETVRNPDRRISLRPRIAVPLEMRRVMLGAGLGVFAAFSVLGLFSSLVPTFLDAILGVHNFVLVGGASFLIFVIAAFSQAVSAALPSRRSVNTGLPLLLVCLAGLESALFTGERWLFVAATVAGGVAVGFIFRGGLSELNRLAQPRHRAAVVSAFFVAAYLGLGLPVVLVGLISQAVGPVDASAYVSALAAAAVVVAFVVVRRTFGITAAPTTPCTPSRSSRARERGSNASRHAAVNATRIPATSSRPSPDLAGCSAHAGHRLRRRTLPGCVMWPCAVAAQSGSRCQTRGGRGEPVKSDTQIRDDVIDELRWDPQITEPDAIGVAVTDGAVTLTGSVPLYAEKLAATRAAERVYGIKAVANELTVKLAGAPRDDSDIARAIAHVLENNVQVPEGKVHARVEGGWVTLDGEVEWGFQRHEVERMARQVRGVVGVTDNIVVSPPSSPQSVAAVIEETFRREAEIDARHIRVEVSDHTAKLYGQVHSLQEANAAAAAAAAAPGISRVDSHLVISP